MSYIFYTIFKYSNHDAMILIFNIYVNKGCISDAINLLFNFYDILNNQRHMLRLHFLADNKIPKKVLIHTLC